MFTPFIFYIIFIMEFIIALAIFIFVLIFYSQIMFQLKKGDDMEIYELDYTNNKELNDSANLKQPFIFLFSNFDTYFKITPLSKLIEDQGNFDIVLKETSDYHSNSPAKYSNTPLTLSAASTLMKSDSEGKYYRANNAHFIMETNLFKQYKQIDAILQTPMCVSSNYDVIIGSHGATTPLAYHTNERRFLYVIGGKVQVKMTPWRSNKYMVVDKDFTSPLNVWNPQEQYKSGFLKMKFLDFVVHPGHILYVPPFWFYSMQFEKDNRDIVIHQFDYGSIMNVVANLPNLVQHVYRRFNCASDGKKPSEQIL